MRECEVGTYNNVKTEQQLVPLANELRIISQEIDKLNDSYKITIENLEIGG